MRDYRHIFNKVVPYHTDDSLSLYEFVGRLYEYLKDFEGSLEEAHGKIDEFITQFSVDLNDTTKKILTEWKNDGTLEGVISLVWEEKADKTYVDNLIDQTANALTDNYTQADDSLRDQINASVGERLAQTADDLSSRGVNIFKYKHLVPNIDELVDYVEGDWSQALQAAMDDLPDKGGTIFIPTNIGVENTVIYPTVSTSQTELKPITLKGVSESRVAGVRDGYMSGLSAIEFRGEGSLFDLRLGSEANTNGFVAFIDLALHGNYTEGTIGIDAYDLRGAIFDNVMVRRFGIGLRGHDIYYATFENFRTYYSIEYGVYISRFINGTKFHRCSFSDTSTGTGFYVSYGGVAVNFDSCWFENNKYGIYCTNTQQLNLLNCYFENNTYTSVFLTGFENSNTAQLNSVSCFYNIHEESVSGIRYYGDVNIHLSNTCVSPKTEGQKLVSGYNGNANVYSYGFVSLSNEVAIVAPGVRLKVDVGNLNKDGLATFENGIGVGNSIDGDVTSTAKTKKIQVFDKYGEPLGYVQLYAG